MDMEKIYKKYVEDQYFYRAFSGEQLEKIKKEGLNPKECPYNKRKKKLIQFFKILNYLEKKNSHYAYMHWHRHKPPGKILAEIHIENLNKKRIYFTQNKFGDLDYYKKRSGGDIPLTVKHVAEDLLKWEYPITQKQKNLVKEMLDWARERTRYKTHVIKIPATSKYLEGAKVRPSFKDPIRSPYGSFNHFKKIIKKTGWRKYKKLIFGEIYFQLEVYKKIPPHEIIF